MKNFNALDKDHDSYLEKSELSRHFPWLRHADRNGDGKVSIAEFMAEAAFDAADGDGFLSRGEFKKLVR